MFDNITTTEETETIVRRSMTIVLNEEEATAALVNPAKLLKRIRSERAKWHDTGLSSWSRTGHAGGKSRAKTADAMRPAATRKLAKKSRQGIPQRTAPQRTPCPYCAKLLDPRGSHKHLQKHEQHGDPLAE